VESLLLVEVREKKEERGALGKTLTTWLVKRDPVKDAWRVGRNRRGKGNSEKSGISRSRVNLTTTRTLDQVRKGGEKSGVKKVSPNREIIEN